MTAAQLPALDPSQLVGLEPGVAYAALAVIALGMLLFYLGPGLRARFSRATPPADPPTGPLPPALPAVMDRADAAVERLVGHLERQLVERDRTIADQDRDLDRLRMDNDRLRDQLQWRRGPRDTSS